MMQRGSHALPADGGVWLVDPVSDDAALAAAEGLGPVKGVLQLLDRHPRDCEELAERYSVTHHRLPEEPVSGAPFEFEHTLWLPGWRELHLWWPERRVLIVSEAVGSSPYFGVGRRAGIHPMLRLHPPEAPRHYEPEHLFCGHGPPLHGEVDAALDEAYSNSIRDIPGAVGAMFRSVKP